MRSATLVLVCAALFLGYACAKLVPTPVGYVEERCFHQILRHGDNIVESNSGEVVITNDFDPSRRVVLKPSGCKVQAQNKTRAAKSPQEYDGWLAYTTYQDPVGFDAFYGYFSVPQQPSEDPQVLYLFTGLQNVDWIPIVDPTPQIFDIIQPVLQYPGDEGDYWSVKSWYVTLDAGYLASDEVQLNVGGQVYGNMSRVSGSTWYIGSTNVATGQTTSITVTKDRLLVQPWAYNTAECYGCCGCSCEPTNTIQFTKLILVEKGGKVVTPKWVTHQSPNPICNEVAHVISPSSVTISFQQ